MWPKPRLLYSREQVGGQPQLELTQAGPDASANLRATELGNVEKGAQAPWRAALESHETHE